MKGKNPKKNKNDWEGFCDCPICQAMENGKAGSLEDLKIAFAKAKEKGAYVGGDLFPGIKMAMKSADKNDLYYDAMDLLDKGIKGAKEAEKLLTRALKMDENYMQTYIGFIHIYEILKDNKQVHKYIDKAYEITLKKFSKWPRRMEWGDIDNRAYMRAIQYRADLFADDSDMEKAVELYRLLLKMNPDDNQGVRYTLAGLYAGISREEINKMFAEGNKIQNWDKLEDLVHKFKSY